MLPHHHEIRRETGRRLRRHVLRIWESRGGGFYGFVATLMFLYLETIDLAGDVIGIPVLVSGSMGGLFAWAVANIGNAVANLVRAAIWPASWIQQFGVGLGSGLLLALAYGGYRLARPSVLRLLQDDDAVATSVAGSSAPSR